MIAATATRLSTKRVLIGVAVSMVAHVALLYAWRPVPPPYIAPPPPAPLVLHLQPPAPPVPVIAPAPAPAPVVKAAPVARSKPAAEPHAPRQVIAVAPRSSAAAEPDVVVEAQPVETPPPVKKFDMDAARSAARTAGVQEAPNADDAPLARLRKQNQANEIKTESKAAQAIAAAKRSDCKDGLPGGLLAPLIMLTQKAGTGCKW
jgi:type IV secretory pathway VirB10-like protein